MNAHDLAELLLEGPDEEVFIRTSHDPLYWGKVTDVTLSQRAGFKILIATEHDPSAFGTAVMGGEHETDDHTPAGEDAQEGP